MSRPTRYRTLLRRRRVDPRLALTDSAATDHRVADIPVDDLAEPATARGRGGQPPGSASDQSPGRPPDQAEARDGVAGKPAPPT